jgi:hypothetical protein
MRKLYNAGRKHDPPDGQLLFIEHVRASSRFLAACQDNLQPATLARLARQVDQKNRTGDTYRVLCRPSLHGREGELVALQAH